MLLPETPGIRVAIEGGGGQADDLLLKRPAAKSVKEALANLKAKEAAQALAEAKKASVAMKKAAAAAQKAASAAEASKKESDGGTEGGGTESGNGGNTEDGKGTSDDGTASEARHKQDCAKATMFKNLRDRGEIPQEVLDMWMNAPKVVLRHTSVRSCTRS